MTYTKLYRSRHIALRVVGAPSRLWRDALTVLGGGFCAIMGSRRSACRATDSGDHGYEELPLMLGEDHMEKEPTKANVDRMWKFARTFADKSGTSFHPNAEVTEVVVKGLALHQDELGKPLCPCNFYPDKAEEVKKRRWICACDEMQAYKD